VFGSKCDDNVGRFGFVRLQAIRIGVGPVGNIAVPALLWLTWRRNADGARDDSHLSFRDWAVGDFDTLTGPVKGANATVEVLLPIAAVAVGMTVLGLVFHIIAGGAA
jgi:hypothetical protein